MDPGELLVLTADLVEALAEATDHGLCEDTRCILCSDTAGRDVFTVLGGLERAFGEYLTDPEAQQAAGSEEVERLLSELGAMPPLARTGPSGWSVGARAGPLFHNFDPRDAMRLYTYLKGVSLNLRAGTGWPRIET